MKLELEAEDLWKAIQRVRVPLAKGSSAPDEITLETTEAGLLVYKSTYWGYAETEVPAGRLEKAGRFTLSDCRPLEFGRGRTTLELIEDKLVVRADFPKRTTFKSSIAETERMVRESNDYTLLPAAAFKVTWAAAAREPFDSIWIYDRYVACSDSVVQGWWVSPSPLFEAILPMEAVRPFIGAGMINIAREGSRVWLRSDDLTLSTTLVQAGNWLKAVIPETEKVISRNGSVIVTGSFTVNRAAISLGFQHAKAVSESNIHQDGMCFINQEGDSIAITAMDSERSSGQSLVEAKVILGRVASYLLPGQAVLALAASQVAEVTFLICENGGIIIIDENEMRFILGRIPDGWLGSIADLC